MAEQLEDYVFGGSSYPWDDWLNQKPWRLTKGEDFKSEVTSFQSAAHNAAKEKGLSLKTSREGDDVVVIQASTAPRKARKKAAPKAKAKAASKASDES